MDEKQVKEFVKVWNEKNGYEDGVNETDNMRAGTNGDVYWNTYDSPVVNIEEIVEIYNKVKSI